MVSESNRKILVTSRKTDEGWEFEVVVGDDTSETDHVVQMSNEFYTSLNTDTLPEEIIKMSFEFLLTKESKESILREFNIKLISTYFPEYLDELSKRLQLNKSRYISE